jgi:adenosylcobyric acid synthase
MVCGTSSDAGKSHVVTGLCRLLARGGVRVAPFKAQNMALNSYVTPLGHEIGRAQATQAMAAGVPPEVAMNPILLKPTGDRSSQLIVNGVAVGHFTAAEYHQRKPALLATVMGALEDLRRRFDVVILEGAGSPAEINLLEHDIVNLRIAAEADLPAVVVGDIDRGGVFASLYGTLALLPDHYRRRVQGFIINKFRGDVALLEGGLVELERLTGVPTIGVLPWVPDVGLDAEDSLALAGTWAAGRSGGGPQALDVAVVRLPRVSNFTDLDPLVLEPQVSLRWVESPGAVGDPDLLILPGTKATVSDLRWLRDRSLDGAIAASIRAGATVLGVCGGYQMLGRLISDEVESGQGEVAGLGWLDVETVFEPDKITRQRQGRALGTVLHGYEIHHGRTHLGPQAQPWITLQDDEGGGPEGALSGGEGAVYGTNLHGLFEDDGFRAAFLAQVARRRGRPQPRSDLSFSAARTEQFDRLADLIEAHVDGQALQRLLGDGAAAT